MLYLQEWNHHKSFFFREIWLFFIYQREKSKDNEIGKLFCFYSALDKKGHLSAKVILLSINRTKTPILIVQSVKINSAKLPTELAQRLFYEYYHTVNIAAEKLSNSEAKPRGYYKFEGDNNRVVFVFINTCCDHFKIEHISIGFSFLLFVDITFSKVGDISSDLFFVLSSCAPSPFPPPHTHTHTNTHTHTHKHTASRLTRTHKHKRARTHTHTQTNTHTYTHPHAHTHTHTHEKTRTHTHSNTHAHAHIRTHTHTHTCTHTHTHTHTNTHTHAHKHTHTRTLTQARTHIRKHTDKHTHTHTEISTLVNLLKDLAKQTKYSIIWSASGLYYDELKSRNIDGPNFMLTTKVAQLSLVMMKEVMVFLTHAGNLLHQFLFSISLFLNRTINFFSNPNKIDISRIRVILLVSSTKKLLNSILPPPHTHTHTHPSTHHKHITHTHTHTHTLHTCTHTHTHTHTHKHLHTHSRTHTHTHTQTTHTTHHTRHTRFFGLQVCQTVSIIRLRVYNHSFIATSYFVTVATKEFDKHVV